MLVRNLISHLYLTCTIQFCFSAIFFYIISHIHPHCGSQTGAHFLPHRCSLPSLSLHSWLSYTSFHQKALNKLQVVQNGELNGVTGEEKPQVLQESSFCFMLVYWEILNLMLYFLVQVNTNRFTLRTPGAEFIRGSGNPIGHYHPALWRTRLQSQAVRTNKGPTLCAESASS